jgi:hypothetical protein
MEEEGARRGVYIAGRRRVESVWGKVREIIIIPQKYPCHTDGSAGNGAG